jgi:hypothetical protein
MHAAAHRAAGRLKRQHREFLRGGVSLHHAEHIVLSTAFSSAAKSIALKMHESIQALAGAVVLPYFCVAYPTINPTNPPGVMISK